EFQKVRPATRFSVEEGDELHLTDALLEGRIDLIVGRIDASSMTSEMSSHILYNEATVVVCGTDNPIAYLKGE
ncbi:LysR substrate-binding domain-containing protein, partial [Klebsiella aerogenes]|uniref:LysR substrate-binding domain-containing protein n=1 Tax=Klebsiella aerogenes TaxID=548 RepID=UPI00195327D4